MANDPWFRLHSVFAPQQQEGRLLAIHALFAMLERTLGLSEEALSMNQLAWWQAELAPDQAHKNAHPVIRALRATGALDDLDKRHITLLLGQALDRLRQDPVADEAGLKRLCNEVGWAFIAAEWSVLMRAPPPEAASLECAGTGLSALMWHASIARDAPWWFMPLELQAKHQCDVHAIGKGTEGGMAAMQTLSGWGDAWFEKQVSQLARSGAGLGEDRGAQRHLLGWTFAQQRRLRKGFPAPGDRSGNQALKWGLRDFLWVWYACRRKSARAGVLS